MSKRSTLLLVVFFLFALFDSNAKPNDIIWAKYGADDHSNHLKFSNDSKYLYAYNSNGRTFRVYDVNSKYRTLIDNTAETRTLYTAGFSKDNNSVALCFKNNFEKVEIKFWNLADYKLTKTCLINRTDVISAVISPDFKFVVGIFSDHKNFIYDVEKDLLKTVDMIDTVTVVNSMAFTPTGDTLAVAIGNVIQLLNIRTNKYVGEIKAVSIPETTIEINNNGNYLLLHNPDNIQSIYSLKTKDEVQSAAYTSKAQFFGNSYIVLPLADGLMAYDLETKNIVDICSKSGILNFAVYLDSKNIVNIAYTQGLGINIYNFKNADSVIKNICINDYRSYICNNGQNIFSYIASTIYSKDGSVKFTDPGMLDALVYDNIYYKFNEPDFLNLYDINTNQLIKSYQIDGLTADLFLPTLDYCFYIDNGGISRIVKLDTKKEVLSIPDGYPLIFSKNSKYTAFTSFSEKFDSMYVYVIDLANNQIVFGAAEKGMIGEFRFLFSNDEKSIFCQWTGQDIEQFDIATGKKVFTIPNSASDPKEVILTPFNISEDDQFLIYQSKNLDINIFNLEAKTIDYTYSDYYEQATSLCISPLDMVFAGYNDGTSIMWKARFGDAGVDDQNIYQTDKFKLYPNPTTEGNITIKNDSELLISSLSIINPNGKVILEKEITEQSSKEIKLNLSSIFSGNFFLKIKHNKGFSILMLSVIR